MSWFWDKIAYPALEFFDPSGALHTTKRQELADQTNQWNLLSSQMGLAHQIQYDTWAQKLAERNADFVENRAAVQEDLARHPITTLLSDASVNGVSPMAALGQSVGTVSVGNMSAGGNSSVGNNQASNNYQQSNVLPSLLQTLSSSVLGRKQQEMTERMFNKELDYKYTALQQQERLATEKNNIQITAQEILRDMNTHKKSIDWADYNLTKNLNAKQQVLLESQVRELEIQYKKSMAEIEHMHNIDEAEKQHLKNERERTFVNALTDVLGSIIAGPRHR